MKKILVPLDSSANSEKALRLAVEIAEKYGSKLIVLNVVSSPVLAYPEDPSLVEKLIRPLEARGNEALDKAADYAADHGIAVDKRLDHGDPATRIIEFALKEGITLVVMGKRGLSPVKSFLIGSVSNRVVQHAKCPVLVVY